MGMMKSAYRPKARKVIKKQNKIPIPFILSYFFAKIIKSAVRRTKTTK